MRISRRGAARSMGVLSLAIIAPLAFATMALASPTGTITHAAATPDWTHGTVAGSVTWSDCTPENHCKWLPEVVAEPSLPEYHCASQDALSSDPNVRAIWNGGSHTANGTVNFEAPGTLILQGVFGQRACLMAIYNARYREPVCIAQWEVFVNFDKENGLPPPEPLEIFCPLVDHAVMASIAGALFNVEQAPVITAPLVTAPAITPPAVTPLGGGAAGVSSAQIIALLAARLTPSGKAAKVSALLKSGGYTVVFNAPEAGAAVIGWYQVPAGAKLAQKAKPVLVGLGRRSFAANEVGTIRIKLTAAGKPLLKHAKQLRLTAKGTFTPAGATPVTATRTFVLKR